VSLSASDYNDFTRIMALYKLYYLLTYLKLDNEPSLLYCRHSACSTAACCSTMCSGV